jgi:hypothetical protein
LVSRLDVGWRKHVGGIPLQLLRPPRAATSEPDATRARKGEEDGRETVRSHKKQCGSELGGVENVTRRWDGRGTTRWVPGIVCGEGMRL